MEKLFKGVINFRNAEFEKHREIFPLWGKSRTHTLFLLGAQTQE